MEYIYDNTIQVYNKGRERILKLLNHEFKEEAVILTVSICEVLLKDFCKTCRTVWFYHVHNHHVNWTNEKSLQDYKIKIRSFLSPIKAYNSFLESYYIYQGTSDEPDFEALNEVLFGKNGRLNFQNLTDDRGASETYKFFFGIDLKDHLDSDKKSSHKKWLQLHKLVQERHNIIHNGSTCTMTTDEIREVISSLDYLKEFLIKKIGSYYPLQDF